MVENLATPHKPAPNDHLANERTFLAWIRTSIAIMGFGFVVVKFSLFIRQLSFALGEKNVPPGKGYSPVIVIALVIIGSLMALLALYVIEPSKTTWQKELTSPRLFSRSWWRLPSWSSAWFWFCTWFKVSNCLVLWAVKRSKKTFQSPWPISKW